MQDLARLKRRTGMQIHGLLVGKSESKPLSKLCTKVHDFLIGYDTLGVQAAARLGGVTSRPAFSSLSAHRRGVPLTSRRYGFSRRNSGPYRAGRYSRSTLYARDSLYSGEDEQMGLKSRKRKRQNKKNKWADPDEDDSTIRPPLPHIAPFPESSVAGRCRKCSEPFWPDPFEEDDHASPFFEDSRGVFHGGRISGQGAIPPIATIRDAHETPRHPPPETDIRRARNQLAR